MLRCSNWVRFARQPIFMTINDCNTFLYTLRHLLWPAVISNHKTRGLTSSLGSTVRKLLALHSIGEEATELGADGGSRTRTGSPPQDFKSCVSTSSTTSAWCYRLGRRCQKSGVRSRRGHPRAFREPALPATSERPFAPNRGKIRFGSKGGLSTSVCYFRPPPTTPPAPCRLAVMLLRPARHPSLCPSGPTVPRMTPHSRSREIGGEYRRSHAPGT